MKPAPSHSSRTSSLPHRPLSVRPKATTPVTEGQTSSL
ncbi:hypothetical protein [Enterobacter phage 02_vB_Eclo_IJM]|nr:hypothetical protein [Enterobacter phage 02_vB_Eclo_IJM]